MIPALPALSFLGSVLDSAAVSRPSQAIDSSQASAAASSAGADFSQILANVSSDAVNALKSGEATSIAGVEGKASVQQVAESVMSAEQSLHTAVAIRDKLVAAYQSLTQMAI